jgi:CheY-like chemotaxis protein
VCLATLVAEAVEITRPRWQDEATRRRAVIRVDNMIPALPPIRGHEPEIREALTNLIFNAVDAMPSGGTLTVTARIVEGAAGEQERGGAGDLSPLPPSPSAPLPLVELDVSDTGVGVPEEIRQRIFDPFFTTKGPRGTGLGLSVVYGIMERHGGSVGVTSVPGQGTTFTLRFQVADSMPMALQPPAPAPALSPRRLLIAEDEAPVRDTLVQILRTSGHDVVEAEDGPAALALLAERGADCLITDLGMPGMLGWEVAATAKALRPDLPVILLTGWGETVMTEAGAESAAVDRVLSKPVRLADLLKAIRELTGAET